MRDIMQGKRSHFSPFTEAVTQEETLPYVCNDPHNGQDAALAALLLHHPVLMQAQKIHLLFLKYTQDG